MPVSLKKIDIFDIEIFVFYNLNLYSFLVDEKHSVIFNKLNRRIEHITQLKANTSLDQSEHMLVRLIIFHL